MSPRPPSAVENLMRASDDSDDRATLTFAQRSASSFSLEQPRGTTSAYRAHGPGRGWLRAGPLHRVYTDRSEPAVRTFSADRRGGVVPERCPPRENSRLLGGVRRYRMHDQTTRTMEAGNLRESPFGYPFEYKTGFTNAGPGPRSVILPLGAFLGTRQVSYSLPLSLSLSFPPSVFCALAIPLAPTAGAPCRLFVALRPFRISVPLGPTYSRKIAAPRAVVARSSVDHTVKRRP